MLLTVFVARAGRALKGSATGAGLAGTGRDLTAWTASRALRVVRSVCDNEDEENTLLPPFACSLAALVASLLAWSL